MKRHGDTNCLSSRKPGLVYKARKARRKAGGQLLISTHSEVMLANPGIEGNFLILKPGSAGESTQIVGPSDDDITAMEAGMTPADILLPQTGTQIGTI
jgi:hypothetical protein